MENLSEKPDPDASPVPVDEIKKYIKQASVYIKITVFNRVRLIRRNNPMTEDLANRIIPVFEALIDSDSENKYHRNHAQLAYILKDKDVKEYERAIEELSKAIAIRDIIGEDRFLIYEFVRAVCRIENDSNFKQGKSFSKEDIELILKDLQKVNQHSYWKQVIAGEIDEDKNKNLIRWIKLNNCRQYL